VLKVRDVLTIHAEQRNSKVAAIDGLQFESNRTVTLDRSHGWFARKVPSSDGPLISDFVTHEREFRYGTYGIHVGQDDRLTFMGSGLPPIIGHFVDCREGSPTCGAAVSVEFAPSTERRLIIPRGVAHTFDNLACIVTRDEPVWYADTNNPSWNVDNDLISFSRDTPLDRAPRVRGNRLLLTDKAHCFMSRMSQTLLANPVAYLNRFEVELAGAKRYIAVEPKSWVDDERELQPTLERRISIAGVGFRKNRYALTGRRSWTVVPNTDSCVADVLVLEPSAPSDRYFCHARTQKIYTVLSAEGTEVELSLFDARARSATNGLHEHVRFAADPRVHIVIPNGVAYRIRAQVELLVRCEHVVFADAAEPRHDIPMFNADLIARSEAELAAGWRVDVPALQCPGSIVYQMARVEQSAAVG
jgi:hypothetical protein